MSTFEFAFSIYSVSTDESNGYLTVYLQINCSFSILIATAGHTFIRPGVVDLCIVDGESGRRLVVANHADVLFAGLDFLPGWSKPVDFLGPTDNYNPNQMNISAFMG